MPVTVDESGAPVMTAQERTAYAIVNGITTPSVTTSDPSATITVRADNNGGLL